jgi:hypothetical protein
MKSKKKAIPLMLLAVALGATTGCDTELGQAFDDVRAAAPAVCKDYCEEKIACEWPKADGPEEDAAFSSRIRECTVTCAWHMSDGAYVTEYVPAIEETQFVDKTAGKALTKALDCLYDLGAFHCNENEDPPDTFMFEPRIETQCEFSADCIDALGIALTLVWDETGASPTCLFQGEQSLEIPFF